MMTRIMLIVCIICWCYAPAFAPPVGVCCYSDGSCQEGVLPEDCIGGEYIEGGTCTDCSPPATGSCCYYGGCENEVEEEYCNMLGGNWVENGDCDWDCLGSCCFPDESRSCLDDMQMADCNALGGEFTPQGNCAIDCGEPCEPNPPQAYFPWPDAINESQCLYLCPGIHTLIVVGPGLTENQEPVTWMGFGCAPSDSDPNRCNDPNCSPPEAIDHGPWVYNAADGSWSRWIQADPGTAPGCICVRLDDILSVELASFNAVTGNQSITLRWQTASETDNDHFDIVRNSTTVGRVDANGSSSGSSYEWSEDHLTNGAEYTYTVSSVDIWGGVEELFTINATPTFNSTAVTEYALHQNYPNPFNPSTTITFDLVESGHATIIVCNSLGQTMTTLVNSELPAGRHSVNFNAEALPSGIYFYRMEANDFIATQKMALIK